MEIEFVGGPFCGERQSILVADGQDAPPIKLARVEQTDEGLRAVYGIYGPTGEYTEDGREYYKMMPGI